ncbi:hypothetical protein FRC09_020444 [Ceratobasidium sp. 395]|nr:hypothetical protein FRC09_020444 [Ceratobasidium sp. 395]
MSSIQDVELLEEKNKEFLGSDVQSVPSLDNDEVKPDARRLLRKVDRNIIPWVTALYLLSFLDRSNIGNARLDGLEKDLGMQGLQFNHAVAIFYPFYVLVEVPANIMLKRTRPSFWFAFLMVTWGTITTLMGLVKSYHGLLIARVFLGIAEGGLFPGIAFYITLWYRREETGARMAIYFAAATAAGAFGGLLARGITEMAGLGGLKGWAWIFILEGILTVIFGAIIDAAKTPLASISYFFIPDYPSTAKFLTPAERHELTTRLDADNHGLSKEFNMRFFWDAVKDWKTYVPPYVAACILTVVTGMTADRLKTRGRFLIGCYLLSMVGFIMLLASPKPAVQYAAVYIAAAGAFPNAAMVMAWCGNFGGSMKRGIAIAMVVAFGNLGGLLASYTYIAKNAPRYTAGHSIIIAVLGLAAIAALGMHIYCRRENARRNRTFKAPHEYTEDEIRAESTKGDQASFFRYID